MRLHPSGPVARRFPLVARPRPACTPLQQRVTNLRERAAAAARSRDIGQATAVFNLAALLASDCGLPGLARIWCHRLAHASLDAGRGASLDAGRRAVPMTGRDAAHRLEPIVNLARLRTRAGDGLGAFALLDNLYAAVTHHTDITIDGIDIPLSRLTATRDDHHELRSWMWTVLLSTGGRALAAAGHWEQARRRLAQHKGIGHRMLDGRQIAVLAHATAGDHASALTLLRDTQPGEPWETAVTACLTLLSQPDQPPDRSTVTELLATYRQLDQDAAGLAVFHTRLGLSFHDALTRPHRPATRTIATGLIRRATTDGYAARDILGHPGCRSIATTEQTHTLTTLVEACGLDCRCLSPRILADLTTALDTAEPVITHTATDQARVPPTDNPHREEVHHDDTMPDRAHP